MSDLITDAMVEAAARTEWTHERHIRPWEKAPDDLADHCRGCSRNALEAAAPAIAAKALRDAAADTDGLLDLLVAEDDSQFAYGSAHGIGLDGSVEFMTDWLEARAERIERGES